MISGSYFHVLRTRLQIGIEPCGFCGLEDSGCVTQIMFKKDTTVSISSTCELHYAGMRYKSAKTISRKAPCMNIPIHCPLCPKSVSGEPQTIWKYNAVNHLLTNHSTEDPQQPGKYLAPKIPGSLMVNMFIRMTEERMMQVTDEATRSFREENELPSSGGLEEMIEEEERQKRGRAVTVSQVEPNSKRRKK